MQALILAGGEGTRLRPLTSTVPKPVVPLVDRPFIAFMLEWLRAHGVDDIVMSCGHLASGVRDVLGDGSAFGVRLRYMEEPRPLGTGGALKLAEPLLDERFLMLNGDVLSDIDLGAQLRLHEQHGARATLALVPVEDPSAYGLVRTTADGAVTEFVEKPAPDQIDTDNISAGAYVLERSVLELLEPGQPASIERDVFPRLVGHGLYACVSDAYWLDIGTPEGYLRGTFDILEGTVGTSFAERAGTTATCASAQRRERGPHHPRGAGRARLPDRRRRAHRRPRGARERRHDRRGDARRGRGGHAGRRDRRALHAARLHRRGRRADRRPHARRGDGGDRRRRRDRRAQRAHQRRAPVPRRHAPRRCAPVLMMTGGLSRAEIAAVDSTGQAAEICDLGVHLRDALWRVDSAALAPLDAPGGIVVAGMGGSAVGAFLARGALHDRLRRPLLVADGYELPSWVGEDTLVLCSSYSGTTEETLACYDAAQAVGAVDRRRHHRRRARRARPLATASRSSRCPAASSRAPPSATRWSSRSRRPR